MPGLRTTRTMPALGRPATGLLDPADADVLADAWRMATRVRNAVMLVRGRPATRCPPTRATSRAVAAVLGYPPGESGALLEDYRRTTRRARMVVERVFYGQ